VRYQAAPRPAGSIIALVSTALLVEQNRSPDGTNEGTRTDGFVACDKRQGAGASRGADQAVCGISGVIVRKLDREGRDFRRHFPDDGARGFEKR
jgi:hypothetical protein